MPSHAVHYTITHRGLTTALAFGWAICVLVYSVAHLSGGQLNPAVSLALFASARLPPLQVGCR